MDEIFVTLVAIPHTTRHKFRLILRKKNLKEFELPMKHPKYVITMLFHLLQ